jgi:hypothetical protein
MHAMRAACRAGVATSGLVAATIALAHGVAPDDQAFFTGHAGIAPGPFLYFGAKHMVTGYDHLLFLAGVVFFLHRLRDVALYVTLFALGHSTTLLLGVLADLRVDPHLVDAVIGASVAYKAFENLGGLRRLGLAIDTRCAVFAFGLCHGFGLATKLQELALAKDGLVANLLCFNAGVELGQFAALALILLGFNLWRASGDFTRHAWLANTALLGAGLLLCGQHLAGYIVGRIAS